MEEQGDGEGWGIGNGVITGVGALDLLEPLLGLLDARRAAGRRAPVRVPYLRTMQMQPEE
jgi:hypothetical protein